MPDVQQRVFTQQLRIAVDRGIPITVHTREAEEDTDRITNEIMRGPIPHSLLHHSASASSKSAHRLACYAWNLNIAELPEQMSNKRILLETDMPYM
ncbi:hypothetical protein EV421DRAFT_1815359 [Armillaria borealis]|uniref:Metallo-dependent hydrolase n=1 Tax=Armillaria borealis TaxID=47425 RepID=A0AA39MP38_9AGAR|nr:hypothetical protein EV421DRAFT_1815359 [Armillaria borealis]